MPVWPYVPPSPQPNTPIKSSDFRGYFSQIADNLNDLNQRIASLNSQLNGSVSPYVRTYALLNGLTQTTQVFFTLSDFTNAGLEYSLGRWVMTVDDTPVSPSMTLVATTSGLVRPISPSPRITARRR